MFGMTSKEKWYSEQLALTKGRLKKSNNENIKLKRELEIVKDTMLRINMKSFAKWESEIDDIIEKKITNILLQKNTLNTLTARDIRKFFNIEDPIERSEVINIIDSYIQDFIKIMEILKDDNLFKSEIILFESLKEKLNEYS